MSRFFAIIILVLQFTSCQIHEEPEVEVLIIGGGASGVTAGIQSTRLGAKTMIVEETPWLGGMLTSAGVSAIDGNYELNSGLWREFKEELAHYYGGLDSLKTGWVSNVLFEPKVGAQLLSEMCAKEQNLQISLSTRHQLIEKSSDGWRVQLVDDLGIRWIKAKILIDATELGDVLKQVGVAYDIGMDSREETSEDIAPQLANDIIQDLTYVAILKDYGSGADKTIEKPTPYDPEKFYCTCAGKCSEEEAEGRALWDCQKMMEYGKLPNGYYMINWPINGNDFYTNVLELNRKERSKAYEMAKQFTLQYVYYLQTELGFKHLGLAEDVYPTDDLLPFIPYHRESRRMKGKVRFTINDLAKPFEQSTQLYRTGVAVGDYPVDHHHHAYPDHKNLPDLHFYPVPSYTLPMGSMLPSTTDGLIVAEKSISVSNLVNGTTRLQPVCMLIGQAAGAMAALSVLEDKLPNELSVRQVQNALIEHGAYIQPYSDMQPEDKGFWQLQRIGSTGILRGEGKNIGWKNHTHIYPDSLVTYKALNDGLADWIDEIPTGSGAVEFNDVTKVLSSLSKKINPELKEFKNEDTILDSYYIKDQGITRRDFAILIDSLIDPFSGQDVDLNGLHRSK